MENTYTKHFYIFHYFLQLQPIVGCTSRMPPEGGESHIFFKFFKSLELDATLVISNRVSRTVLGISQIHIEIDGNARVILMENYIENYF